MYERSYRLVARWIVIFMTMFMGMATWGVASEGMWEMVAGGPVFAVLWYALAVGALNRTRVRVDGAGVAIGNGPLPVAPAVEFVPAAEVATVYVRHAVMPTRTGAVPYLAAGVERRDGRWVDVTEPLIADERVWAEAREMAAVLGRGVEERWGRAPKTDWKQMRMVWYWTGAVLAGILWGCYVELVLRR
jgi:hypothetical protein